MEVKVKNSGKIKRSKRAVTSTATKTKEESINSFFGKLPKIGDGLAYQKKVRNEW